MKTLIAILSLFATYGCEPCPAADRFQAMDEQRLIDAIGCAENSIAHPYGIMVRYQTTTPRQACVNTVHHILKHWRDSWAQGDPIEFIGRTYAPIGAANDPYRLNANWVKNVKFFYNKEKK